MDDLTLRYYDAEMCYLLGEPDRAARSITLTQ